MPELVTTSVSGGVAQVLLARPEKLNALTMDTLEQLVASARGLARDRTLRGVVLGAEGESFCAGLDFATVMKDPARLARGFVPRPWRGTNLFQEACWAWRRLPVPVLAAVRGHCYGGGLQIALGADFRMTTPDARWAVLESKWGLIPDMSGVQALSQQVGLDVAKRLTMTGEVVSGVEAVRLGLASEVADDPEAAARDLIARIAVRSPDAVAAAKRVFEDTWQSGPRRTFARERVEQARLLLGRNARIAQKAGLGGERAAYRPRSHR